MVARALTSAAESVLSSEASAFSDAYALAAVQMLAEAAADRSAPVSVLLVQAGLAAGVARANTGDGPVGALAAAAAGHGPESAVALVSKLLPRRLAMGGRGVDSLLQALAGIDTFAMADPSRYANLAARVLAELIQEAAGRGGLSLETAWKAADGAAWFDQVRSERSFDGDLLADLQTAIDDREDEAV